MRQWIAAYLRRKTATVYAGIRLEALIALRVRKSRLLSRPTAWQRSSAYCIVRIISCPQGWQMRTTCAVAMLFVLAMLQLANAQEQTASPTPQPAVPSPSNSSGTLIGLHPTSRDFRVPRSYWKNPFSPYTPTTVDPAVTVN